MAIKLTIKGVNMTDHINTIVIPSYIHPNYLATCIRGLIKNSRLKHKIIIIGSKTTKPASDFIINPETFKVSQKYKNMAEYLSENDKFLKEHDITYIDCTEEIREFTKKLREGNVNTAKIIKPNERIEDGVFIAFKNNFALNFVETEYVINNWDADFYAAPEWDVGLLRFAEEFKNKGKYMLIPNHVVPFYYENIPDYSNIFEDFRKVICYALIIPSNKKATNNAPFVTEKEWNDFINKWKTDEYIIEKPGDRYRCHWVPILYRTDEFKQHIGAYNYQGSCYDIEIDNRSGEKGFMKICAKNSFILHKGWIPYEFKDC